MVRSISAVIAAANFMATVEQVRQLAGVVVEGASADGTYFRVLGAHLQSRLGKGRRARNRKHTAASDEEALDIVHGELYPAVLEGVGPEDLAQDERNRRATFARSAASTWRYFIGKGGDVRAVDLATVTKAGLRKAVEPQEEEAPEGETRVEKSFRKAANVMMRACQRLLARGDPDAARERIEAAIEALEGLLDAEPQPATQQAQQDVGGTTTTFVGRPGTAGAGRGAPAGAMLHRPAG